MNKRLGLIGLLLAGALLSSQTAMAEEAVEAVTESVTESVTEEAAVEEAAAEPAEEAAEIAGASDAAEAAGSQVIDQKLDTAYTLALYAINDEDYDKANSYLDVCMAYCDPSASPELYADLLLKKACIDVIQEDYDMALFQLDAALYVDPELADAYLVRTQVYTAQGDIDQAVANLQKYIDLTEDTTLYQTIAQLHEANGDMEQAEAAYEKFAAANGEEVPEALFQTGLYRMESGKFEEAIEAFETYRDDEDYGAGALYNIGVCHLNMGDYETAEADFTGCIEKEGLFDGVYYNRGVCRLMAGNWESAAEDFEQSVSSESYAADAQYNLAVCRMQSEDYEGAVEIFTDLIGDGEAEEESVTEGEEMTGDEPAEAEAPVVNDSAYYYRALCYAATGNLEDALADYTTCIDHGYDLAESYYQRAQIYAALGDKDHQTADLEASLRYAE